MKTEDDPAATDSVYVQLPQLEVPPPAPVVAPDCRQYTYIDRRTDLLFKSTSPPRPCKGCGECPCLQTQFESVSSLPVGVQNPLRYQMTLLVGAVFTAVAITSWLLENQLYVEWLAYDLIFVAGFVLNMYGIALVSCPSPNVRLQFGLLSITIGAFFAGIDNAMVTCSLFTICCAVGFIFLVAAACMKRNSSYQSSFSLEEASPVSPVKASVVAYLLAAIVQITLYAGSDDSAFLSCDGLIGCLIAECVLVACLLWELSQMTRAMKKEEVPGVLGCLYLDLLGLAFMTVVLLCWSVFYVLAKCVTCGRFDSRDERSGDSSTGGLEIGAAAGGAVAADAETGGAARVGTAQRESLKMKLGDAFQKKIRFLK